MNIESVREYCLSLKGCEESLPFDEQTLVFKVMGKIFIMMSLERQPPQFNFKALPEKGLEYREKYPTVLPGYHSNKKHWNTVILDQSVPEVELQKWITDSYHLIIESLPKYKQKEFWAS